MKVNLPFFYFTSVTSQFCVEVNFILIHSSNSESMCTPGSKLTLALDETSPLRLSSERMAALEFQEIHEE